MSDLECLLVLPSLCRTPSLQFRRVPPPTARELEAQLGRITRCIARHLERRGLLVRDMESGYLCEWLHTDTIVVLKCVCNDLGETLPIHDED